MKIRNILILSGLFVNIANAAFPTTKELCNTYKFPDGTPASSVVGEAALVQVYNSSKPLFLPKGWQGERFVCPFHIKWWGNSSLDGNLVAFNSQTRTVLVAFEGTDSVSAALGDAEFSLHPAAEAVGGYEAGHLGSFFKNSNDTKLHRGFQKIALSGQKSAFDIVNKFTGGNNTDVKFILTGHSLGGALASLFACALFDFLKLNHNYDSRISVITFGAPKFCNANASQFIRNKLYTVKSIVRAVNVAEGYFWDDQDHITDIPPSTMGYHHVDTIKLKLITRSHWSNAAHDAKVYYNNFLGTRAKHKWSD